MNPAVPLLLSCEVFSLLNFYGTHNLSVPPIRQGPVGVIFPFSRSESANFDPLGVVKIYFGPPLKLR